MKSPANPDLEAIVADGLKVFDRVKLLEDELGPRLRDEETRLAAVKAKLAAAQKDHAAAKAGYAEAWAKVEADEKKVIDAKALQIEDVEAGKISMSDYLKRGEDAVAIAAQAKAAADRKLSELASLVRTKAIAVIAAEADVADSEANLGYLYQAPAICLTESVKDFLKRAEGQVASIHGGGFFIASLAKDKKLVELAQVQGLAVRKGTKEWHDLDEAGLRSLLLDPAILPPMLDALAAAIARAAGGEIADVRALYSPNGSGERLEVTWQRRTFEVGIKT